MAKRFEGDPQDAPAPAAHDGNTEPPTLIRPATAPAVDYHASSAAATTAATHSTGIPLVGRTDELVDSHGDLVHPFRPDWTRAFWAGLFSTILFMIFWAPLTFIYRRPELDPGLVIGSCFWPQPDMVARLIGMAVLLGAGVAAALSYAYLLTATRLSSTGVSGLLFGIGTGIAVLVGVLPFGLGLMARFSPFHPYFDMPGLLLDRVSGGEGGDTGWTAGFYALGLFAGWGAMIGGLYKHHLSPGVTPVAVTSAAAHSH